MQVMSLGMPHLLGASELAADPMAVSGGKGNTASPARAHSFFIFCPLHEHAVILFGQFLFKGKEKTKRKELHLLTVSVM